jgi:hypothetical protein
MSRGRGDGCAKTDVGVVIAEKRKPSGYDRSDLSLASHHHLGLRIRQVPSPASLGGFDIRFLSKWYTLLMRFLLALACGATALPGSRSSELEEIALNRLKSSSIFRVARTTPL